MVEKEKTGQSSEQSSAGQQFGVSTPAIQMPKGGGAIHGMGEKFAANPVTGTGSMSIPVAISPGRSGFGPGLSISYDSGAGNGVFGLGWNLSLPAITRKTDKGLPKYQTADESDVFILSGAEDLVPEFEKDAAGNWVLKDGKQVIHETHRTIGNVTYLVRCYRPRIEGLFARIECWTNQIDPSDIFWRSISKDDITTWYGKTAESRIVDPIDGTRIFSWQISQSHDDKGNVIVYGYQAENSDNVDVSLANESNRSEQGRSANRYLKRIRYGNHTPYLPVLSADKPWPVPPGAEALDGSNDWFFEVVFDYGEHNETVLLPQASATKWPVRNDPFSTYRAGFEVRTYRLCQRVLMFHHFPGEAGVGANCLVRSTDFNYSYEHDPKNAKNPIYSYLESASQISYKRNVNGDGGYISKSLPPLEFKYTQPIIDDMIQDVDPESLENLPYGLDGSNYQWVDLDGEGLSGILTEQGNSWFYKRNLSANHFVKNPSTQLDRTVACFSPIERVASKPNTLFAGGQAQFMDLAGDGQADLVEMEGAVRGFYERTADQDWEPFQVFTSWPNVDTRDPNLKFIDLTGDGHADILISEDEAFIWHASLAEAGFSVAQRVQQQFDEEKGPRLVFADSEQSIFLADLSGDGLTDLVRIRNGEVCYWPNLGYCRFGAKVTMDTAPWFDGYDQFNPRRIRLADIDGSGTTDILYLHSKGVHIYFNQSGNSWGQRVELPTLPVMDNLAAIQVMDLLCNGTACLVWSSPLPQDARCPMRYIDLMGGQKPHLLISMKNNLGAETTVHYAPSTQFYLQDKDDGTPWITKLPFPVHVVDKVTVTDKWRNTSFSSTYSYHHGYFDGIEREFRGFGRVEQVDVEAYGKFEQGNAASPYVTDDKTLYQPPIKTITWYHTGVFIDREQILSHFDQEYFPRWLEEKYPGKVSILGHFQENSLPQPDLDAENLSTDEWREALRACKGMMLRQEIYELDIDALENSNDSKQLPVKLFSSAYHNCHIRCLQPKATNQHAVFLVAESEAITYHYELDIREEQLAKLQPDPRIAHTLNLQYDEYANVLQSVAVVYPRREQYEDNSLNEDDLNRIRKVQKEQHLAYTETRYTEDFSDTDNYRLRMPCEVLAYELAGIVPEDADDKASKDPRDNLYFTLDELRRFQLSLVYQPDRDPDSENKLTPVASLSYHELPKGDKPEKRLVEHTRTLFFAENLVDPLPFGEHGRLGLTYENYKLALTDILLDAVFKDTTGNNKLDEAIHDVTTARDKLNNPTLSGYLSGEKLTARFTSIPVAELTGQYWMRSGIAGFAFDAAQHFYLPERYTDAFDNITTLEYDGKYDLYVASSTDMLQNKTEVTRFDYRVLAPSEMRDINGNLSEVYFDVLGLPTAMAIKGKGNGTEGDNLLNFTEAKLNPSLPQLTDFFVIKPYDEAQVRDWLGNATTRHVYYFGETRNADGIIVWGEHPACACGIVREQHVTENSNSPIQSAFEYSDGMGSVVVKKVQAEPEKEGDPLRWVANGKTILNNKGKPVKQYEPYFSSSEVGHRFEEPREEGVTPLIYYDAIGRVVRTEMPDGTFSRVEFSPWHVQTFDQNDTVMESQWYVDRNPPNPDQPLPRNLFAGKLTVTQEQRAAWLAAQHRNTPTLTLLDSLGREVISIAHNRMKDKDGNVHDEKYLTFTKLDAEGKPLWIRDARNNLVMQYINPPVSSNQATDPEAGFVPCYDIAGNLLFQHSMDAGDRWLLNDAAGKPMLAWNSRGYLFYTEYDALHRPIGSFVKGADPLDASRIIQFEKVVYGETPNNGLTAEQITQLNLRGKPYQHYDMAGLVVSLGRNPVMGMDEAFDFKGNLLRSTRQLVSDYKTTPDWAQNPTLETEIFSSSTRYDALNRPIQLIAPHGDQAGAKVDIIRPGYNEANLLERMDAWLQQSDEPTDLLDPQTATLHAVKDIDYNAKGQRVLITYGNGAETRYDYDPKTFRLSHLLTLHGNERLQDLFYTYDPVGNITHICDNAQQTVYFRNQIVEPSAEYTYDALYRLLDASGREHLGQVGGTPIPLSDNDALRMGGDLSGNDSTAMGRYLQQYVYDAVGNILAMQHRGINPQQPGWKRCYQYAEDSNRLLSTSSPNDAIKPDDPCAAHYGAMPIYTNRYDYDAHGNMVTMPHLPLMAWDFNDQLMASSQQVRSDGGTPEITYYVYDGSGQRVRKVTERQNGTRKNERIYLGGFEVYREYNGDGHTITLERQTLHVMDDKQRVALVETRTQGDDDSPVRLIRYQFGNHLGSASLELDEVGRVISYEEYYPYGSTSYQALDKSIKVAAKRYRYTGKERDEETGLYYHGARYYTAWLVRWIEPDPFGLVDGNNRYAFNRNNPIRFVDPDGSECKDFQGITVCTDVSEANARLRGFKNREREFVERLETIAASVEYERQMQEFTPNKQTEHYEGMIRDASGAGVCMRGTENEVAQEQGRQNILKKMNDRAINEFVVSGLMAGVAGAAARGLNNPGVVGGTSGVYVWGARLSPAAKSVSASAPPIVSPIKQSETTTSAVPPEPPTAPPTAPPKLPAPQNIPTKTGKFQSFRADRFQTPTELQVMVSQYHEMLDKFAQSKKTTALGVIQTPDGLKLVIASSDKVIPKALRDFALSKGIFIAKGSGHAEIKIRKFVEKHKSEGWILLERAPSRDWCLGCWIDSLSAGDKPHGRLSPRRVAK